MGDTSDKPVVYYDGSCPLCRAEIDFYDRRDRAGKLQLCDISRPDAHLPDGLSREAAMARFHVAAPDGTLRSGARGFIELWRHLPGWRHVARIAALPGIAWGLERLYRLFLRFRPTLVRAFTSLRR